VKTLAAEAAAAAKKVEAKPDDQQALDEFNCAVERLRRRSSGRTTRKRFSRPGGGRPRAAAKSSCPRPAARLRSAAMCGRFFLLNFEPSSPGSSGWARSPTSSPATTSPARCLCQWFAPAKPASGSTSAGRSLRCLVHYALQYGYGSHLHFWSRVASKVTPCSRLWAFSPAVAVLARAQLVGAIV
jgi:hypothetical protein